MTGLRSSGVCPRARNRSRICNQRRLTSGKGNGQEGDLGHVEGLGGQLDEADGDGAEGPVQPREPRQQQPDLTRRPPRHGHPGTGRAGSRSGCPIGGYGEHGERSANRSSKSTAAARA